MPSWSRRVCPVLARYELLRGKAMSKKLSGMLVLCVSALWLSGCAYFRSTGPCLWRRMPSSYRRRKWAIQAWPSPETANRDCEARRRSQRPSCCKRTRLPRAPPLLPTLNRLRRHSQRLQQANAAQAKPSTGNRFTDFFAHLIPHHNKTAKSGSVRGLGRSSLRFLVADVMLFVRRDHFLRDFIGHVVVM